jgi:hypothetical protein
MARAAEDNRSPEISQRYGRETVGTLTIPVSLQFMGDDATRFRSRAIDCRALAKSARTEVDRAMLEEIAEELDAEARKIEREAKDADQG